MPSGILPPQAMSANIDLVRSIYAAWERRDYAWTDWAHPDVEFVVIGGPSPGRWVGLAGMWQGWREILSAWDDWRVAESDYRELDEERVLALIQFAGRGKASGIDASYLGGTGANLWHIHQGVVRKLVAYWDIKRALADLGLPSEAD